MANGDRGYGGDGAAERASTRPPPPWLAARQLLLHLGGHLLRRLFGGGRSHRRRHYGYGYGRRPSRRTGFFGPFPYHSRRTRGGSRVTVSGCCLPIPLGLVAALATGARLLRR